MLANFVLHAADAELEPEELRPDQVVSGTPRTAVAILHSDEDGRVVRGIWEITPGVVTDVEADELFVVVHGRATIEIDGGPVLEVGPGDAAVLQEGTRTTWTVHETLRKVFQITVR